MQGVVQGRADALFVEDTKGFFFLSKTGAGKSSKGIYLVCGLYVDV